MFNITHHLGNANRNHNEVAFHIHKDDYNKNTPENYKCWWGRGETRTLTHCWWECKTVQQPWKTGGSLKMWTQNYHMTQPFYFRLYTRKNWKQRLKQLNTNVHCSVTHNSQNLQTIQCPSTNDWINKVWYVRAMENYSVVKRNEILIHVTVWVYSKVSQT